MSYFSSKSTWLSLVDTSETGSAPTAADAASTHSEITHPESAGALISGPLLDGITLSCEDFRPCFPAHEEGAVAEEPASLSAEDLDYLRITRDLRHRLFFHFKEWEFGPALLEDHIRLAQAEADAEEALAHYCQARHVAVTLADHHPQPAYTLAMLETDRVIAEIHSLLGNYESCALYAKEGLETIKKNHFDATLDMRITKLTVRFLNLLGRK